VQLSWNLQKFSNPIKNTDNC